MIFRLHSIWATLILLALSAASGRAQQQPAQAAAPTGQQAAPAEHDNAAPLQQSMPPAPIEPVMSGPYPVMSKAAEDRAREIFQMFNRGEFSQMYAALSEGRKKQVKEDKFIEGNKKFRERMGTETATLGENMVPSLLAPDTVYSRLTTFSNVRPPLDFVITLNQRGLVDDFEFNPVADIIAEGRYAGYEDTAKLRLPFNGAWLVYQGGRTAFENPYATSDDQRFGLDFVLLKNGQLFSGPGGLSSKNTDYYCFGQPILAPFDGTVSRAIAGFDDNLPGRPSGDPSDGNVIVITHEEGDSHESVLMNHLKQNSLKVKHGDKVKQGDVVAECGNSGAGPVPHLHFQLEKTGGNPLPAQFVDYLANGKPVASGEPKRGQFVQNGPSTSSSSISTASGKASVVTASPAQKPKQ